MVAQWLPPSPGMRPIHMKIDCRFDRSELQYQIGAGIRVALFLSVVGLLVIAFLDKAGTGTHRKGLFSSERYFRSSNHSKR